MISKALLLLLCVVLHQVISQGGMFEELFTLDCNMIAHILPNTPIAANIDVAAFGSSYNFFTDKLKTRLKSCKCPNVSDRFFNRLPVVGSLEGLLHQFDESSKYDDSCSLVAPAKPGIYYSPPATCTLENVSNGSPCNIKAFLPTANVTLQLSIDKCPTVDIENRVPYISMTCIGSGCKTFGRPCAAAADCGSIAFDCHNIGQAGFSFSHPMMERVLDIIGITTNGTCATTANIYSTFMRDYLSSFYGMIGLGHAPSFCLPKSMTADATDLGMSSVPIPQPSTTGSPQPTPTLYCGGIANTDRRVCGGYGSCVPTTNDTSVGYCKCSPSYYGGNTCNELAVCNGITYSNSSVCNSKGRCEFTSKYGTARCICNSFAQLTGDNCDQPISCYGILATNTSVCNKQGFCSANYVTGESECTCYSNWGGQQCNERIMCNGVWSNDTNVCSAHGSCRQTTDYQGKKINICECRTGWGGPNCDQVVTCNGTRFDDKNVCNGQGTCVWSTFTSSGTCSCNANYTGYMCEYPRSCGGVLASDKQNVCSGVGTCSDRVFNGPYSCFCPRGRLGTNCENIVTCNGLPYNDRNVCSGNGTCNNDGTCSCYARYSGANCDITDAIKCNGISELDRSVCSGRGSCGPNLFTRFQPAGLKSGKCNCYSPYQGNNCEKQPDCSMNGCISGKCNAYGAMEPGTGFCECQDLFWGKDCSQPITCSQPCQNGGRCVSGPNGDANGMCSCSYAYYGPQCQYTVKCKGIAYNDYPNVCGGDGSCSITTYAQFATTEVTESGKCTCRSKMGKYCEKDALTAGSRVTIDAVTAWDGILADGTSVTSDDRKTGKVFKITMPPSVQRDAKFVTLLRTYCNGEISVLPESVIGIRTIMPRVYGLLQALYNTLSMSRSCTSGYNNDLQRVLLQLWNLDPWLFMNTNPASTSTSIAQYAAYTSKYVMDMIGMGKPMIKMPTTCSYDTWKTTGKCTISFTALSKLMTTPIKLHLRVERCVSQEAKEGLPLIEFLCEGDICQSLRQLKPCNSDNDCTGAQCVDFYTQANVPNATYVDFWETALNSYNMSDVSCRPTPETTWSDYWSMINYVQGTSYVPTGASFKFCAYDGRGLYNSGAISQWTTNIVTAQADSLQFDGLTDFSGPGILNPDGNPTSLTTTAAATTTAGPSTTTVGPTGLPGDQTKSNSLAIGLGVGLGVGIPLVVVAVAGVIILGVVLKVKLGKRNDDYKQFGAEMNPYVRE